jgi:hypothetical protein
MPTQPLPPDGDPAENPAVAKQPRVPEQSSESDDTDTGPTEDALPERSLS